MLAINLIEGRNPSNSILSSILGTLIPVTTLDTLISSNLPVAVKTVLTVSRPFRVVFLGITTRTLPSSSATESRTDTGCSFDLFYLSSSILPNTAQIHSRDIVDSSQFNVEVLVEMVQVEISPRRNLN